MESNVSVSVVTVVFNGAQLIEKTILSVINHSYPNMEYIIIDGGSTDGTSDIIKKHIGGFDKYICEEDDGIYDAMNKGIALATGDYIIFMNAGDVFYRDTVLAEICSQADKPYDLIYGDIVVNYGYFKKHCRPKNLKNIWKGMTFSHQSLLARAELLKENNFNVRYKLAADFDLVLGALTKGASSYYCGKIVSIVNAGGVSDNNMVVYSEYKEICNSYYKSSIKNGYYEILIMVSSFKQFIRSLLPKTVLRFIVKWK